MHKATFLEGTLRLTIVPDGPILIKAGDTGGADPTRPDMEFVRSQNRVYIPGPSIKGVVRAQAERICRSLDSVEQQRSRQQRRSKLAADEPPVPLADNPLGDGKEYGGLDDMRYSSGRAVEEMREAIKDDAQRTAIIYRRSSFVSQLFGHTSLAGRVRFADAYLPPEAGGQAGAVALEERNGVAIDRIYGSVAVGPFNYEVAVAGSFATRVDFKNTTLAQLGLLGLALRDLADGRVGIGFGKSRGLGRVKVSFDTLELRYPTCELGPGGELLRLGGAHVAPAQTLVGLGALATGSTYTGYDLPNDDTAPLPPELRYEPDDMLGVRLVATNDAQVRDVWRACMMAWRQEIGL